MNLLASFNGGPSSGSLILALVVACVMGLTAGKYARGMLQAFCYALLGTLVACSACLYLGNQQGDASALFYSAAVMIFGPILGILSAVLALATRWVLSHR